MAIRGVYALMLTGLCARKKADDWAIRNETIGPDSIWAIFQRGGFYGPGWLARLLPLAILDQIASPPPRGEENHRLSVLEGNGVLLPLERDMKRNLQKKYFLSISARWSDEQADQKRRDL